MALKKYCVISLVAIMAMVLPVGSPIVVADGSGLQSGVIESGGLNRTYEYYIPSSYDSEGDPVPLLFSFHGLGSSGVEQIDLTAFDVLAEQEGFIAVFPDATELDPDDYPEAELPSLPGAEIQWNLGAESLQYCAGIDDVGFVSDMVAWFGDNYNINESQIYSTGMSDGALFSYLLAFNLTGTFAGIAPVCGPMPWGFGNLTATPITVILMHGTADLILSYNGYGGLGGNVTYSVDETIAYWRGVDNTTTGPVETVWGPTASDSTVVTRYVYSGGTDGTEVILFKVEGGGHTWPGGPPVFGAVTTHIDGSALIWKHLPPVQNYLRIRSTDSGSVTTPGERTFFYDPDPNPIEVNLTAVPDSNCKFVNWTWTLNEGSIGNATAANTNITITPNEDYEIIANFIAQYDLTIDSTDGGSVTIPGEGLFPDYDAGKVVDLVATPASGYRFVSWTGDVATLEFVGTEHRYAIITMNGDYEITANFEEIEEETGGGCFIATAAYGTSTAEQIDVLREFRDDVLLESTVGSRLVDLYYQMSPPVADFISENSFVRTLVRELLVDPVVWLVEATGDIWRN